jgi:hypothetical protein
MALDAEKGKALLASRRESGLRVPIRSHIGYMSAKVNGLNWLPKVRLLIDGYA